MASGVMDSGARPASRVQPRHVQGQDETGMGKSNRKDGLVRIQYVRYVQASSLYKTSVTTAPTLDKTIASLILHVSPASAALPGC